MNIVEKANKMLALNRLLECEDERDEVIRELLTENNRLTVALAQAEQRGEVVGEIVGEFRDAGGWTPNINWQCSGDHPGVGTKLYTAPPAPVTQDDVVKDAARYRWLRDQDYDDGCVIAMKEKHIPRFVNYSQAIDDYIDAAMLAAAPARKS